MDWKNLFKNEKLSNNNHSLENYEYDKKENLQIYNPNVS